jgi:hypothetical protein
MTGGPDSPFPGARFRFLNWPPGTPALRRHRARESLDAGACFVEKGSVGARGGEILEHVGVPVIQIAATRSRRQGASGRSLLSEAIAASGAVRQLAEQAGTDYQKLGSAVVISTRQSP